MKKSFIFVTLFMMTSAQAEKWNLESLSCYKKTGSKSTEFYYFRIDSPQQYTMSAFNPTNYEPLNAAVPSLVVEVTQTGSAYTLEYTQDKKHIFKIDIPHLTDPSEIHEGQNLPESKAKLTSSDFGNATENNFACQGTWASEN